MWTIVVYRSAREIVGFCQDLRQLIEMARDMYRVHTSEPEIELSTRFRECCGYDEEPLFFTENEPHDTGWVVTDRNGSVVSS